MLIYFAFVFLVSSVQLAAIAIRKRLHINLDANKLLQQIKNSARPCNIYDQESDILKAKSHCQRHKKDHI